MNYKQFLKLNEEVWTVDPDFFKDKIKKVTSESDKTNITFKDGSSLSLDIDKKNVWINQYSSAYTFSKNFINWKTEDLNKLL